MREVGGHLVESHGVGTVVGEVVGVVVVRQRARHLGLLVDHLSAPGDTYLDSHSFDLESESVFK